MSDPIHGYTLVEGNKSFKDVDNDICRPLESFPTYKWLACFGMALIGLLFFKTSVIWLVYNGIGVWGLNNTVGWAFDIVNFVFWIGIGHAGTLISAILYLFRQKWRTGINRSAEAMTIFAVICALQFPLLHTGRPWLAAFWLLPYPNERGPLWVNFRSPLEWDVWAVSTYASISIVFWYIGLIPDFATVRDRAKNKIRKMAYALLSLGWVGSNRSWRHYEMTYLILAALSTPLVLSVHTIVSFDFATSVLPGWHTTILPPYFVAGAIFSGFAMVVTLMVLMRKAFNLEEYITIGHMESINKILLLTGMLVGFAYATEFFIAWYGGNPTEGFTFLNRAFGPYAWSYWIMVSCNVLSPQVFWFKSMRQNIKVMFVVSIFVNIGMWFERFVIIVTSLANDFLPANWYYYRPTGWDFALLFGSFGLFFTLFLLFVRFFPVLPISEVKGVMPQAQIKH